MAQMVKNLPVMKHTLDMNSILGLGKSSGEGNGILAWRIPWTEEPGELHFGVAKNKTQLSNEYFYFLSSTFEILILQSEGKMRN